MKNELKVMEALTDAFPGHHVVSRIIKGNYNKQSIFIDGWCVGYFDEDFFKADIDNPEIEIKVKAPLNSIEAFLTDVEECDGRFYQAVERGLSEWREGSHPNN